MVQIFVLGPPMCDFSPCRNPPWLPLAAVRAETPAELLLEDEVLRAATGQAVLLRQYQGFQRWSHRPHEVYRLLGGTALRSEES